MTSGSSFANGTTLPVLNVVATVTGTTVIHAGGQMTADEVLADADAAMYEAKRGGKDRSRVFAHGMRADLVQRGHIEHLLRSALQTPAAEAPLDIEGLHPSGIPTLTASYQPIFDAGTGDLIGFEALARLSDGSGTAIPPDGFITVAEDTGLIQPLGVRMLELACGQLERWREGPNGLHGVTMAVNVNVSAVQAQQSSLGEDVRHALSMHHLQPTDLVLELTESALLQAAHSTIKTLRGLHDDGVGIAIDDFGTGYASLRYLVTLPVSALKVDRSFTAGLPSDDISRKIVNAVAGLAADLGLACIVEGVETQAQRDCLPLGVQLQGWLTGPAEPAGTLDMVALSRQGNGRSPG